jgi:glycosyltransferase involved in cell wall biosynthesis
MTNISTSAKVLRIVTFSTLYPNGIEPHHGVFVENRLRHLVATGRVESRVVAPVPWFPFRSSLFCGYAAKAGIERVETRYGLTVRHPPYLVVPKIGMPAAALLLFEASRRLLRNLDRERRFDVIDAHYFYPDGVAAVMLGQALGKPVIITARGTDINLIPRYRVPRRLIQWAASRAAGIIAVSAALKDALIDLGVPPDRITVLRNGVDLTMFHPAAGNGPRRDAAPEHRRLLSVGHLIGPKALDLTIAALPLLPGFSLSIVGEGPERRALEALARKLEVTDRVHFLGPVPHEALSKIYQTADALVLTSSREGWPNVLLEAMACGTPVVASNIGGNSEIVTRPEAGVLMMERSAAGIADAVARLFQHLPDRAATRRYAERFSWDDTSAGQIALFDRVLLN